MDSVVAKLFGKKNMESTPCNYGTQESLIKVLTGLLLFLALIFYLIWSSNISLHGSDTLDTYLNKRSSCNVCLHAKKEKELKVYPNKGELLYIIVQV